MTLPVIARSVLPVVLPLLLLLAGAGFLLPLAAAGTLYAYTSAFGQLGAGFGSGIVLDNAGVLYVADSERDRVLAVLPDGTVKLDVDGFGVTANNPPPDGLSNPTALAYDGTNLYIADTGNHRVLYSALFDYENVYAVPNELDDLPSGTVPCGMAWINKTSALWVADLSGRLVAVSDGNTGNRMTPIVYSGSSCGPNSFGIPYGLASYQSTAAEGKPRVYVADPQYGRVFSFDPTAASFAILDVLAAPAGFLPVGVAVDLSGTYVFATNSQGGGVALMNAAGGAVLVTNTAFAFTIGITTPPPLAISAPAGQLYLVNGISNTVEQLEVDVASPATAPAAPVTLDTDLLRGPTGVAVDELGNVYIADADNDRVVIEPPFLTPDSDTFTFAQPALTPFSSSIGFYEQSLIDPMSVTVDQSGNVLVADIAGASVYVLNSALQETGVLLGSVAPYQAVRDNNGHLFLSDLAQNVIFVLTSAGAFITAYPNDDKATGYSLNQPSGLALDVNNDKLYVADSGNNRVLVLQASNGALLGSVGAAVPVAGEQLSGPSGVAVSNGVLVISDTGNNRVVSMSTDLTHTTSQTAYTGSDSSNPFGPVYNAALDAAGDIYVADPDNARLVILPHHSAKAVVITGPVQFPLGIAVNSSDFIFVGDADLGLVVLTPYTAGAAGPAEVFQSYLALQPYDVAVDAAHNVYVSDASAGRVAIFNDNGTALFSFYGLNAARGLALDREGHIYVADGVNSIFVLNSITTGRPGRTLCQVSGFTQPSGVAVDGSSRIYVANTGANAVAVLSGVRQNPPCQLQQPFSGVTAPIDVAVDDTGRIYVLQAASSVIVVLSSAGQVEASLTGSFVNPVTLALDASGQYVYVADSGANAVVVLNAAPRITALPSVTAVTSGGIATDSAGFLYLADPAQNVVTKYSPQFSQVASFSGTPGVDFSKPSSVAVDGDSNVWVADTGNDRVVQLSPSGSVLGTFSQRVRQPFALTYNSNTNTILVACRDGFFQLSL